MNKKTGPEHRKKSKAVKEKKTTKTHDERCIGCGLCGIRCPMGIIKKKRRYVVGPEKGSDKKT